MEQSYKGFTLLELIISLSIVGILLVLTINPFGQLIDKNDQQILIDEISSAILYSKIQALQSNTEVYLSPLDGTLNWSKGMVLNRKDATNDYYLLYQWQWHHPQWQITWNGVKPEQIIILSNNPTRAMSNGSFDLYNIHTHKHVAIILNRLGRIKMQSVI